MASWRGICGFDDNGDELNLSRLWLVNGARRRRLEFIATTTKGSMIGGTQHALPILLCGIVLDRSRELELPSRSNGVVHGCILLALSNLGRVGRPKESKKSWERHFR